MVAMRYVNDVLIAIKSVRRRAVIAYSTGDDDTLLSLMKDLIALQLCLEIEIEKVKAELKEIS
jgi:hypothetical protein